MTNDRKLTHRTRSNVAAIHGLTSAIDQHMSMLRIAIKTGREEVLQSTLADLMQDINVIEQLIVEQEQ